MSRKYKPSLFDVGNVATLVLISLTMLYPFVYLLFISISPVEQVVRGGLLLWPERLDLGAYRYVFDTIGIGRSYAVTLIVTGCGTVLSLALTSLGAYVLSNGSLPGNRALTAFLIFTMIFNGGLIPTYLAVKELHLIDTLWALFLPNSINTFWLFIMRNFYRSIPGSLIESARIDGYSEVSILWKIVLPLSLPILATLGLFYGVGYWNQYFNAIIYINDNAKQPLQVIIRMMYQSASGMSNTMTSDVLPPPVETIRAATIMVATLPILCVYPFLQKYFNKGIMVGAVKG